MKQSSTVRNLTKGPIVRQLVQFSVPLILGDLFQLSYNMADTVVIGRFAGSVSLAAVGTCDQIMTLLILGVSGICIGASVLMGRFFGAGRQDLLLSELKTTVALGLIFSLAVLALGFPLAGFLFRLMAVQPEALPDASVYMRVIFIGLPFTCLYNIYAAALRSVGDSATPVRYLILSNLLNTALDLLFVAGFGWGVFGAGLATVLAQAVSAVLCILFIRRRIPILCFPWRELRVDRALARQTVSYGGITALQQCAQPIGNLIIQGSVNLLGVTAAAAFSAARKVEDIGLLPGRSVSSAVTSFTAQNTGAREYRRTEEGFRKAILLETACGVFVSAAVLLLRSPLMSLFTKDPAVTEEGVRYFSIIGFCYLLPCLTNGFQGYFRGTGRMTVSLLGTLTQISVRVIVTLLAVPRMGIPGVGLACVAGWSAMLLWQVPYRRIIKNRMLSQHPVHE